MKMISKAKRLFRIYAKKFEIQINIVINIVININQQAGHKMVQTRSNQNYGENPMACNELVRVQTAGPDHKPEIFDTLSVQETQSINSMSFVPTKHDIIELCARERDAQCQREQKERGPILSKLHFLSIHDPSGNPRNLLPESLDPEDTVLVQLGATVQNEYPAEIASKGFAFVPDRNMTFGGGSCGPNGVLVDCHGLFGSNRINLFRENPYEMNDLLKKYLSFRNQNEKLLFDVFINHLNKEAFTKDFKIDPDPKREATLPSELRESYLLTVSLFNKVQMAIRCTPRYDIESCGIGCVSFCQTWIRNGHDVGDAQFSVCSPHFQTRFFVKDADLLSQYGVSEVEMNGYSNMIKHLDESMSKDYGIVGGGQAFINLDELLLACNHMDLDLPSSGHQKQIQSPRRSRSQSVYTSYNEPDLTSSTGLGNCGNVRRKESSPSQREYEPVTLNPENSDNRPSARGNNFSIRCDIM